MIIAFVGSISVHRAKISKLFGNPKCQLLEINFLFIKTVV